MKREADKVKEIVIAYIGGGSRGWAFKLMQDLALESRLSGTVRLYDIDREAAEENRLAGNRLTARVDVPGKWVYETAGSLEKALTGADFVIISILPGTFKEMAADVHIPEKYGIYQSVGDTAGPGGLMRSLRTVPMYVEIAESIRKYSPLAWVINYTNPMALCLKTLYSFFPDIKAFGCCHEVFGTQELLAAMLFDMMGIKAVLREEIKINVLGVNHFTWIESAYYQGMDLFPVYENFTSKYRESGFIIPGKGNWEEDYFMSANRVKFDLFRRYGLIAAAGDRHLAEFLPPWYLKDPETVRSWKFHLTPVSFRIQNREEENRYRKNIIEGKEELDIKPSAEEGVRQIKALLGMGDFMTNVNLPNRGQITGIPENAVVETNAWFSADHVRPVLAGSLPPDIAGLVNRHALNQEAILQAALKKDKKLALNALLNEPLVTLGYDHAAKMLEEMMTAIKDYLPGWDI